MTAIGFVLFVLGWVLIKGWGTHPLNPHWSKVDYIGVTMNAIGFVLGICGIAQALWEHMP